MPTPTVVRQRRAIKAGLGLLLLSLVVAIIARFYLMYNVPPSPEKQSGLSAQETEILALVNQERARDGLPPLKFSPRLAIVARGHSYDMAMRHYLAHNSPDGVAPADRISGVGVRYRAVGENIYLDDGADSLGMPRRAMNGWLKDPAHLANIVSAGFTETGVGIAQSADGNIYITQDFLR